MAHNILSKSVGSGAAQRDDFAPTRSIGKGAVNEDDSGFGCFLVDGETMYNTQLLFDGNLLRRNGTSIRPRSIAAPRP